MRVTDAVFKLLETGSSSHCSLVRCEKVSIAVNRVALSRIRMKNSPEGHYVGTIHMYK